MKTIKILLSIILFGLIFTQLIAILKRIGSPDAFDAGFIVGKLLLIGLFLIIGKMAIKVINQNLN